MGTGAVKQSRMRKQSIWQSRPSLATPNPCATSTTEYGQSFLFVPARALKGWAELEGNENVGIWITIMPLCLPSKHKPCRKKKNNKHQSKPVKTAAPSTIPNHLTVPTSYPTTTTATPPTPPPSSQPRSRIENKHLCYSSSSLAISISISPVRLSSGRLFLLAMRSFAATFGEISSMLLTSLWYLRSGCTLFWVCLKLHSMFFSLCLGKALASP